MLTADSWKTNKQLKDGVKGRMVKGRKRHHLPPAFLRRGLYTAGNKRVLGQKATASQKATETPLAECRGDPAQSCCSRCTEQSLWLRPCCAKYTQVQILTALSHSEPKDRPGSLQHRHHSMLLPRQKDPHSPKELTIYI